MVKYLLLLNINQQLDINGELDIDMYACQIGHSRIPDPKILGTRSRIFKNLIPDTRPENDFGYPTRVSNPDLRFLDYFIFIFLRK